MADRTKIDESRADRGGQLGYTLVELLGVCSIIVFLVLATQGLTRNYKRFAVEETAVQRLKELSRVEHSFRYLHNPALNPLNSYGTFFDLQNANLIPDLYVQSDEKRRTVNAYVPFYRLNFVQNTQDYYMPGREDENITPDENGYIVRATPLSNSLGLKTFFIQEDGEVYWFYYQNGNTKLWPKAR